MFYHIRPVVSSCAVSVHRPPRSLFSTHPACWYLLAQLHALVNPSQGRWLSRLLVCGGGIWANHCSSGSNHSWTWVLKFHLVEWLYVYHSKSTHIEMQLIWSVWTQSYSDVITYCNAVWQSVFSYYSSIVSFCSIMRFIANSPMANIRCAPFDPRILQTRSYESHYSIRCHIRQQKKNWL